MKKFKKILFLVLLVGLFFYKDEVGAVSNTTLLHLESPTATSAATSLMVNGWAMSTAEDTSIKIYLNDQELTGITRLARNDVINAVKDYGDSKCNPLPGFSKVIDLSTYRDGNYQLSVKVLSKNNLVLANETKEIKITKYKSLLTIEDPASVVEGTSFVVGGWVMSTHSSAILKTFLDGKEITDLNRFQRNDVINVVKGYGDSSSNPTSGFNKTIDVTHLNDGAHTLEIILLNPLTNEILERKQRTVTLKKYKYMFNLESPLLKKVEGTALEIAGWLMSTSNNVQIHAYIDDTEVAEIARVPRNDVLNAVKGYGDSSSNPYPGFSKNLDLSQYDDGNHTVKIQVVSNETKEIITEQKSTFILEKYKSLLHLETPAEKNVKGDILNVSGWVMSANKNASVKIYLNDIEIKDIDRISRNDVVNAVKGYGDSNTNSYPGFTKELDLSLFNDGEYSLSIKVFDQVTGALMDEETKKIALKKYKTVLNNETPQKQTMVGSSLKIEGWMMSTAKETTIEVLLDDKIIEGTTRFQRNDVLSAVKGYGTNSTNPTPGYQNTVDTRNLKDGAHFVTIRAINAVTKEVLATETKTILLKKYQTTAIIENLGKNEAVNRTFTVEGWLMSTALNETIRILIDGREESANCVIQRFHRQDVVNAVKDYGDISVNPTPGYEVSIDMTNYSDGKHTIQIEVISPYTEEVLYTAEQQILLLKYKGLLTLESPNRSNFNHGFTISGWEMSELDQSYIKVFLNGQEQKLTIDRYGRGDVVSSIVDYGDGSVNQAPGFSTFLDLTNTASGDYTLTVVLYSKLNEELTKITKRIVVYKNVTFGIDVSYYQGNINWSIVSKEGIDFAMVRLGYRGYGTSGSLNLDLKYQINSTGAIKNNVPLGLYFFSQAITEEEAREEANYVLNNIKLAGIMNQIKYPIVYDTEYSAARPNGRADNLSRGKRTAIAKAFLTEIGKAGHTPMLYASKSFLYDNLDMSQLNQYDVWVAHYNKTSDPTKETTDYTGVYHMWQYTSEGSISGISGNVDLNIAYKNYH